MASLVEEASPTTELVVWGRSRTISTESQVEVNLGFLSMTVDEEDEKAVDVLMAIAIVARIPSAPFQLPESLGGGILRFRFIFPDSVKAWLAADDSQQGEYRQSVLQRYLRIQIHGWRRQPAGFNECFTQMLALRNIKKEALEELVPPYITIKPSVHS